MDEVHFACDEGNDEDNDEDWELRVCLVQLFQSSFLLFTTAQQFTTCQNCFLKNKKTNNFFLMQQLQYKAKYNWTKCTLNL